ncbi:hypothetical protein P152DRAFT_14934 [Eremomyces bilateralis CBS 781.70]|uniref:Uncharacterized protein n=1 Tax=Eremomyces bilateralis CBS 781.70 TaxID=1392243 RepID=A0A6G1GGS7_9PEZI|nr:uncharacterized protein P152DRAFT_14934 [Eremomyces bilateralis CBS 781.70]KAF1817307.1 hypothetical protein P152DRAFT_14934 [Eremomyces bilateralis CBS 781.70]
MAPGMFESVVAARQYAQSIGITKDFAHERISEARYLPSPSERELQMPINGPTFDELCSNGTLKERISWDKDSLAMFRDSIHQPDQPSEMILSRPQHSIFQQLMFELPLLTTDNDHDMLCFSRKTDPAFSELDYPRRPKDDCQDMPEDIDPESKAKQTVSKIMNEKLVVDKTDFLALRTYVSKEPWRPNEEPFDVQRSTMGLKSPLTPPLLPLSRSPSPYVPSSPARDVPIPSEHSTNSAAEDARMIEEQILLNDTILPMTPENQFLKFKASKANDGPEELDCDPSSFGLLSSPAAKRTRNDLLMEVPLTPGFSSERSPKRLKQITLADVVPNPDLKLPSAAISPMVASDESPFEAILNEQFQSIADDAKRMTENERLIEADSTNRMSVPIVHDGKHCAPWEEYGLRSCRTGEASELAAQSKLLKSIQKQAPEVLNPWHGAHLTETRLKWIPFLGRASKVTIDEGITSKVNIENYLRQLTLGSACTSEECTWKPEVPSLLAMSWGDENVLDRCQWAAEDDINCLTSQRKVELDGRHQDHDSRKGIDNVGKSATGTDRRNSGIRNSQKNMKTTIHSMSTRNSANNYFQSLGVSIPISAAEVEAQSSPKTRGGDAWPLGFQEDENRAFHGDSELGYQSLHDPPTPSEPRAVIVSSILLSKRGLVRSIRTLYPSLVMVQRDWSSHLTLLDRDLLSSSSPVRLSDEADIIYGANRAVILSTVLEISQRALPGAELTSRESGIHGRISRVATRYAEGELVVLVHETIHTRSTNEPQELVRLRKWAVQEQRGIGTRISIAWICGSNDDDTARAIIGEVIKTNDDCRNIPIRKLEEESEGELVLRRAGINALAALSILNILQERDTTCASDDIALDTLARMGHHERLRVFGHLVGAQALDKLRLYFG